METASLLVTLLQPASRRAVHKVLAGRFSRRERNRILSECWRLYRTLEKELPPEETLGARVMVRLAAATAALYGTLRGAGLSGEEALKTVAGINWLVYRRMADVPWALSRALAGASPIARVRKTMGWLMVYPYSKTGYDMHWKDAGRDTAGFDVFRCPVADYFRSKGLNDLCKASFCDLDYPLADRWRVRLVRPRTLSQGHPVCDFRFVALP
ncbi:MAG: L-2-amino-thiazoline-4-carboxylic acid hydrolase [Thermodesulfobacteriota bacterium]